MSQRLSTRTEKAIGTWQFVAEELIREPVRDAVREALAEEGIEHRSSATGGRSRESSSDDGRSILSPKLLLPLLGLAAAMFYARQRRSSGEGATEGISTEADERTSTGRDRRTQRAQTDVTGEGGERASDEDDAEGSDEEATARS